jgi:hypothetical protein
MINFSVIYYSTLALCALLGELSTGFILHLAAWVIAMAVTLGKVIFENMCDYKH